MLRWAGCLGDPLRSCHTRGASRGGTLPRAAFYTKFDYVDEPLSAAGRRTMIDWIERRNRNPSLGSGALLLDSYGGALNRPKPGATAFVHRDELFCIQYGAYFEGPAAQRASHSWVKQTYDPDFFFRFPKPSHRLAEARTSGLDGHPVRRVDAIAWIPRGGGAELRWIGARDGV
jgi:hypothetical protein